MWLLPIFPGVARLAAFVYYRMRYRGPAVPPRGPVLLVANHPNSLLDPMLVVAAARRPVRFLAKAPLFVDRKVGWLVRGAGAIPVYRRQDDPAETGRNAEMFLAVHEALAAGAAVAVFPEGVSHSGPSLAPLRTGAARIALGAAPRTGAFPIVPVGLVFREKSVFRSAALVLTGDPVAWDDLAPAGVEDVEAVRQLTARIDAALRRQTLNLEAWHDEPLVDTALGIWEAESGVPFTRAERPERLAVVTEILADIRARGDAEGLDLITDVARHRRQLARLGLRPADLLVDTSARRAVAWAVSRAWLLLPIWIVPGFVGWALYFPPYRLTGIMVGRFGLETDVVSTWKLLIGALLYTGWTAGLAALVAWRWGIPGGLAALVAVPVLGMVGLLLRERWSGAWHDVRRWLLVRTRRSLVGTLRAAQRALTARLVEHSHLHLERGRP